MVGGVGRPVDEEAKAAAIRPRAGEKQESSRPCWLRAGPRKEAAPASQRVLDCGGAAAGRDATSTVPWKRTAALVRSVAGGPPSFAVLFRRYRHPPVRCGGLWPSWPLLCSAWAPAGVYPCFGGSAGSECLMITECRNTGSRAARQGYWRGRGHKTWQANSSIVGGHVETGSKAGFRRLMPNARGARARLPTAALASEGYPSPPRRRCAPLQARPRSPRTPLPGPGGGRLALAALGRGHHFGAWGGTAGDHQA